MCTETGSWGNNDNVLLPQISKCHHNPSDMVSTTRPTRTPVIDPCLLRASLSPSNLTLCFSSCRSHRLRGTLRLRGTDGGRPQLQERREVADHQQHVSLQQLKAASCTWKRIVSTGRNPVQLLCNLKSRDTTDLIDSSMKEKCKALQMG